MTSQEQQGSGVAVMDATLTGEQAAEYFVLSECRDYYHEINCEIRYAEAENLLSSTSQYVHFAQGHVDLQWKARLEYHVQVCRCGEEIPNTNGIHSYTASEEKCEICGAQKFSQQNSSGTNNASGGEEGPGLVTVLIIAGIVTAVVVIILIRRRR